MQAVTLPPWLSPWSSGLLPGQRGQQAAAGDRRRERARQRSRLTIYTYGSDDSHILRIGGWSGRSNTPRPLAGWERYPIDREPWHLAVPPPGDRTHLYPERINVEWMEPTAAPAGRGWGYALRGWMTGTALLALLVLLARAAERCIEKKLFKRRRRSQEWPTPNVRATNRSDVDIGTVMIPGLEGAPAAELPPPYWACAAGAAPYKPPPEEPPPPYSDCYVEFSNKDGVPSVLIFSRRRSPLIDRREIGADERPSDEATTVEQNVENASAEASSGLYDEVTVAPAADDQVDRNDGNTNTARRGGTVAAQHDETDRTEVVIMV